MSELPDLSAQKPYALDQLAQLQGKIVRLSQSMVLQRARIERCRQSDLAAARDIYAELSKTREALVEALARRSFSSWKRRNTHLRKCPDSFGRALRDLL